MSYNSYVHTCNNTLARRRNVIDNVRNNKRFLFDMLSILKAINSNIKGPYDKQNLTLVVILSEIYETRQ